MSMPWRRPTRLTHIAGIGVDRMGSLADESGRDFLRLENLDTDIPPDPDAIARTQRRARIRCPLVSVMKRLADKPG